MKSLPTSSCIWLVTGVTDMTSGFIGLASRVQNVLNEDLFFGHLFILRGRRGEMIKLLWSDDDGLCLFTKPLERDRFIWPVTREGKIHLTPAQFSMLLEGINWKNPQRTERPGLRM
ncbi:IS66 family insertion sequence element accessory protein TnpB [Enterobacter sp. UPMP2060]